MCWIWTWRRRGRLSVGTTRNEWSGGPREERGGRGGRHVASSVRHLCSVVCCTRCGTNAGGDGLGRRARACSIDSLRKFPPPHLFPHPPNPSLPLYRRLGWPRRATSCSTFRLTDASRRRTAGLANSLRLRRRMSRLLLVPDVHRGRCDWGVNGSCHCLRGGDRRDRRGFGTDIVS